MYALTDMGFDDWGAFSILHASGNDPDAILTVSGMMDPSSFSADFSRLVNSWGITAPVYNASDGCHHDCLNASFIEEVWGYRTTIDTFFPMALNTIAPPGKVTSGSLFPWFEGCHEKYRLLILSPMSQFDYKVWEDPDVLKCISELVVSGSFFGDSAEGRRMATNNVNTWIQLIPLSAGNLADVSDVALNTQYVGPPEGGSDSSTLRELNVVSDALAAARSLAAAASQGVKVTIIPIEVESIDRYGMQVIQNNDTLIYNTSNQASITNEFILSNLCRRGEAAIPGNRDGGMLQRMACIHEPPADTFTQYTLDMDAIVATYLWEPGLFTFDDESLVAFDSLSGMTYSTCKRAADGSCRCEGTADILSCFEVKRATDFNAVKWFNKLYELLDWQSSS